MSDQQPTLDGGEDDEEMRRLRRVIEGVQVPAADRMVEALPPPVWYMSEGPDVAQAQALIPPDIFPPDDPAVKNEVRQQWFGPITAAAVTAFQTSMGLQPTGVVDDTTWLSLRSGR